jgi:hypothetical protein
MSKNNIVNTLGAIVPASGGQGLKVLVEFADQPEVLEAIVAARKRRCSFRQISMAVSQDGHKVSPGAIQAYLTSIGVS